MDIARQDVHCNLDDGMQKQLRGKRGSLAKVLVLCLITALCNENHAQVRSVELLGTITANQASNGLGFVLDAGADWQWAAAAAAGATHARIQCSWSGVEQQTKPPNNVAATPQYVQDTQCVRGFASARRYGIHPTVVAAFGPPFHNILTVSLAEAAKIGDSSLSVEFVSGVGGDTLAALRAPFDYITVLGAKPFTAQHSYQGALLTGSKLDGANHGRLMLASAVRSPLSAGTHLTISEILYPSTATERANDPSVVAYGNYVSFLAKYMAARGVTGDIEIWNEPPWSADPWDNRCLLYDTNLSPPCPGLPGSPSSRYGPNYGFVANLQKKTMPPGIKLTWNGTSGSGAASILGPRMYAETGEYAVQPAAVVTKESFHPYGFEPEQVMWATACLEGMAVTTTKAHRDPNECVLPGEPIGPNNSYAVLLDIMAKAKNPAYGVGHEITETGTFPPAAGLQVQQARFIMRQYLGFQADGITPVEFYILSAGKLSDPTFGFVVEIGTTASYATKPNYAAISGFMADIKPISEPPATAYSLQTLPAVVTYNGTFPLSTVHMVGARPGATADSDAFMVWQRSFSKCTGPNQCGVWITQPSPAGAPVTISVPGSMKVTQVVNLTTRDRVSYKASGKTITFMVADDPIEVLVDPSQR